jgi:hypothetical protein
MSQFQPLRPTKNDASGNRSGRPLFVRPTPNITRVLPMEPETAPLNVVAQTSTQGKPSTQGLPWQQNAPHTPLPPTFPTSPLVPGEAKSNIRYLPVPVNNTNVQVRNTNAQGWSNDRHVSISFPMSNNPVSIAPGSALSVQNQNRSLVIPGTRKRVRSTAEPSSHAGHLRSHFRHSLVILATLGTFLIIMLSFTPLEQSNGSILAAFMQPKEVAQSNLNVISRNGSVSDSNGLFSNAGGIDYGYTTDQYIAMARADAEKYGISPDLYQRQIQQESHFDPNAVSWVGAIGIAQFMPATAQSLGFDPSDPVAALDGGARLMSSLSNSFGGDYSKALAAYNAGSGAVDIAVSNCGASWLSCMDPQAEAYVYIIMG